MTKKVEKTRAISILHVFGIALFLSAGLMFMVQPMVGKMLLPFVGGTPAGWIVAVAFFQLMLLAGYSLAHLFSRFTPVMHGALFLVALGLGALFLPVMIDGVATSGQSPDAGDVFAVLTVVLGVPFIALSCASSTLQRLYGATRHQGSEDPYFLYAASNLGSFAGLFLYPFVVETVWTLPVQGRVWQAGYFLLMILVACALYFAWTRGRNLPAEEKVFAPDSGPVSLLQKLEWGMLAFFPSALMLAVTTHITTDIFSAPMVWIVPLGIYLLTMVVAFSRAKYVRGLNALNDILVLPLIGAAILALLFLDVSLRLSWLSFGAQLAAFVSVALMCHIRLADQRPRGTSQLTAYYLTIAVGGAVGGVLNAFVFPAILEKTVEYPILLMFVIMLHPWLKRLLPSAENRQVVFSVLLIAAVYWAYFSTDALIYQARNFYGVVRVVDIPVKVEGTDLSRHRFLLHGTTTHGSQVLHRSLEKIPTTYFAPTGPVGDIFAIYNPKKVLVIGLGAGTLNCYSTPENEFTFIEIDPAVVETTKSFFTYLDKCQGRRPPRIIVGDGRLELEKLEGETFDLIIMDAFSSDMIPTHLITMEAIQAYLAHLEPNGMILFNIANRYFNLGTLLTRQAELSGLKSATIFDGQPISSYSTASKWLVMVPQTASLSPLGDHGWASLELLEDIRPWTDNYTSLMSVLTAEY